MSFSLMIYGGAGAIHAPERYQPSLTRIVEAGAGMLERGAEALDVVSCCVALLEDDPLFNAGCGAVLNADGQAFCDASIMDGRNLAAGAVAGVTGVRNPVRLARLVMEATPHVFMIGAGAERLGRAHGLAFEPEVIFRDAGPAERAGPRQSGARLEAGSCGARKRQARHRRRSSA